MQGNVPHSDLTQRRVASSLSHSVAAQPPKATLVRPLEEALLGRVEVPHSPKTTVK